MSLAENLLNSLDESAYQNTRIGGIVPEEHIKVGQDRVITVPNSLKTIAVEGDKDIETATIDCVRYWDGHDLSTFAIYLNYILPNGDEGTYIPKVISKTEDTFSFDWLIGSEFTYAQGKMTFWIVAKLTDDSGTLIKQWSSFQNSDCTIAQGGDKIYVPEKQTDQDVISQAISISRSSAEIAEQQANLAQQAAGKAASEARDAATAEVSRIIGELGVVQELGNSPNSVISQAKVTKEFANANAKIDRNFKAIENIKAGIPSDEFDTDDSVAYQKDVPANALPFAEVKKIGGMTYKEENTLKHAKVTAIESVGANLMVYPYLLTESTSSGITISANTDASLSANGTCTNDTVFVLQDIRLKAGTYSISNNAKVSACQVYLMVDGVRGDNLVTSFANGSRNFKLVNDSVVRIRLFFTKGTAPQGERFNIWLNKDTATPYTPYTVTTLPIPEAVQALDGYGWGVNADCNNYIDWEKRQFVKCVGKVDMGTLRWNLNALETPAVFYAKIDDIVTSHSESDAILCEGYEASDKSLNVNTMLTGTFARGHSNPTLVFIKDEKFTNNVSGLTSSVSGKMLYYELATPEVTDISDIITADNLIGVEVGGTLTFKNEYGYAVPSEIEYQVEV